MKKICSYHAYQPFMNQECNEQIDQKKKTESQNKNNLSNLSRSPVRYHNNKQSSQGQSSKGSVNISTLQTPPTKKQEMARKSYGALTNQRKNSLYSSAQEVQVYTQRVQSAQDKKERKPLTIQLVQQNIIQSLEKPIMKQELSVKTLQPSKQSTAPKKQLVQLVSPQISSVISSQIPNHEPTKCSFKNNGSVKGYAANTNKGLVRNYNEDRVSIILNIMKPINRQNEAWPRCSFFGVYDGHGGVSCAEFLRDNLHQYVVKENSFPSDPREALKNGFIKAEQKFLELAMATAPDIDKSGSCAIVVMIVGEICYVANVGDSRAVMSGDRGKKVYTLSRDHKPNDEEERKRITNAKGKIYQNSVSQECHGEVAVILGPHRVFPGRLSVSRTFGDIEAKLSNLGGNEKVVICDPEIRQFKIQKEHDFIILASDGIYDKVNSKDCVTYGWESVEKTTPKDVHEACGYIVEGVILEALKRKTCDNVSVVVVGLQGLKDGIFSQSIDSTLEEVKDNKENNEKLTSPTHTKSPKAKTHTINRNINTTSLQNFPHSKKNYGQLLQRFQPNRHSQQINFS